MHTWLAGNQNPDQHPVNTVVGRSRTTSLPLTWEIGRNKRKEKYGKYRRSVRTHIRIFASPQYTGSYQDIKLQNCMNDWTSVLQGGFNQIVHE